MSLKLGEVNPVFQVLQKRSLEHFSLLIFSYYLTIFTFISRVPGRAAGVPIFFMYLLSHMSLEEELQHTTEVPLQANYYPVYEAI